MAIRKSLRAVVVGFAAVSLVACAEPGGVAQADAPRTVAKRSSSDQRVGDENHPKIVAQFGGEIADESIKKYVRDIGFKLARESEQPRGPWTFTVLDSPVVNAFALPGGYVYVTRGLIALANDEAELAGVIGHEIGHVTGAHGAQRQERAGMAQLGVLAATIGAAVLGAGGEAVRAVNQLGNTIGQGYVASFSREQEFEADALGVRYISRAGYDPLAEADFLDNLKQMSKLQAKLAGQSYNPNRVDFFSTHPATGKRVREAVKLAREQGATGGENAPRNRERFLKMVDGMVYGDSAEQGFVRERTFSHPKLRFTFTVPQKFTIQNSAAQVVAGGPNGAGLIFDGDKDPGGSMDQYIQRWAQGIAKQTRTGKLTGLRRIKVNGLAAAQGQMPVQTRSGVKLARMTAIRMDKTIYRFLGFQPEGEKNIGAQMDKAAQTFRKLSKKEANGLQPLRVHVYTVKKGDTIASLSNRMKSGKFRRQQLRVLNGLKAGQDLTPGEKLKLVY